MKLLEKKVVKRIIYPIVLLICFIAIQITCWEGVPLVADFMANVFEFTGANYMMLLGIFDIINSLFVNVIVAIFALFLCRVNAYYLTIPLSFLGFGVFYNELGGIDCIGTCGLPLWYDIAGFVKYPIFAFLAGYLSNKVHKHLSDRSNIQSAAL